MKNTIYFWVLIRIFIAQAFTIGTTTWDYALNGANWKFNFPDCGKPNQSPINFSTQTNKYTTYDFDEDKFIRNYSNQQNGGSSTTSIEIQSGTNKFKSVFSKTIFNLNEEFKAKSIQFHTGSEHTING